MTTDKLVRQIKKELTRNPKKTATLALISVVAIWFWAPLASKWMGGSKKPKKVAAAPVTTPQATTPAAVVTGPAPTLKIDWRQLHQRISTDSRMETATLAAQSRDPFAITATEAEIVAATPEVNNDPTTVRQAVIDPTPEALGLVLEGTLIAGPMRRATISGKTYRENSVVKLRPADDSAPNDPTTHTEFVVSAIEANRVTLERNGKTYPLVLKRDTLGDDEQLTLGAYPQAATTP